jgi:hypothetical protein
MHMGPHAFKCKFASSVLNVAPWILMVSASTIDRYFPATVYFEGPADNAHCFTIGESLADRMKLYAPAAKAVEATVVPHPFEEIRDS